MLRKDIEKLIRHVEPQLIGILIAHGLVKSKKKKFADVVLTQRGKSIAGIDNPLITNEWINEWRKLWPEGCRGTVSVIREKLSRFLIEHDTSLKAIRIATERWLAANSAPYCGKANHFFYKLDTSSRVEESRCEEYLQIDEVDEDYDDSYIITT